MILTQFYEYILKIIKICIYLQRKKITKEHVKNEPTSAIKSGAAAFFGAMGSDWFGSSN